MARISLGVAAIAFQYPLHFTIAKRVETPSGGLTFTPAHPSFVYTNDVFLIDFGTLNTKVLFGTDKYCCGFG